MKYVSEQTIKDLIQIVDEKYEKLFPESGDCMKCKTKNILMMLLKEAKEL